MTAPLVARDVKIDLAGSPVVRGVELRVDDGEFVTLLGANGSGKSTLVRAIVGLIAFQGSIELYGQSLKHLADRSVLGYVPQRPGNVTGVPVTVRELVSSGLLSRRPWFGFASPADRNAVNEVIEVVGLSHKARTPVANLSGGQQQRAHIARALVGQPKLLIMDEPTAGVDHESTEVLAGVLADLIGSGTSVLMVAHELGAMRPLIDRAVVLDGGLVTYSGVVDAPEAAGHHHDHAHSGEPPRLRAVPGESPWT